MTDTLGGLIPESDFVVNVLRSQSKITLREGLSMLSNADEALTAIADALANSDAGC